MKQVSLPDWSDCKSTVVKKVEVVDPSTDLCFMVWICLNFTNYTIVVCFPQNFKSEVLLFLWSLTQHQVTNFESCTPWKLYSDIFFSDVFPINSAESKWCLIFHQCRPVARKILQPRHYFKRCARIEFLYIASSISCSLTLVV